MIDDRLGVMAITRSKLGKLGLAILEGFVGKHLGDGFVDELRSEHQEHENLIRALVKTEDIFRKKCGDENFSRAIFDDLPIITLPSFQDATRSYYNNPVDPALPEIMKSIIFRDLPGFVPAIVDGYVNLYINCLTEQLAVFDEGFRSKITTLSHLESLDVARRTLQAVERVVDNTGNRLLVKPNIGSKSTLNIYLNYVVESHHLLKLHGIYLSNEVIGIELDKIYIPQYVMRVKNMGQEDVLLNHLGNQIPGYLGKSEGDDHPVETETISLVDQALTQYSRLAVLGSPGTGKSTLLSYLALHHAMRLRDQDAKDDLETKDNVCLPIFCALRDLKKYLPEIETDGPDILLNFIHQQISSQQIPKFDELFDSWLDDKDLCCLLLLDGMDEVGDEKTRARVSRVIEKFTLRYPHNRFVVTSRVAGYRHSSRLGEGYKVVTLHPFNESDVRKFVMNCNRQIEQFLSDNNDPATIIKADLQSQDLLDTVFENQKLLELAFIPLLLMIILLVYRERGELPDKRVKIYDAIVDVLLSQWDAAKGMQGDQFANVSFLDERERLLILKKIAFNMHSQKLREVDNRQLFDLLIQQFRDLGIPSDNAHKETQAYIRMIQERTGLLQERGQGIYSFAHLSLQEYLAASALSSRGDFFPIVRNNLADSWWHEVIKMSINLMDTKHGVELLGTILGNSREVDPYDNLFLATECIADFVPSQIPHSMLVSVQERLLQAMADGNVDLGRRIIAGEGVSSISDPRFRGQFLLPGFVKIPHGFFNMGSQPQNLYAMENEIPQKMIEMPEYYISIFPVTNAQYERFLANNPEYPVPVSNLYTVPDWDQKLRACRPARRNRPVVFVSKEDANQYCSWLTEHLRSDQSLPYEIRNRIKDDWVVRLPTEKEWERAARGPEGFEWPWGNKYQFHMSNTEEEGVGGTIPVGIFRNGRSTFGVYDMAGNIFELTQEGEVPEKLCVLKGGAWNFDYTNARCAYRFSASSNNRTAYIGFRVVLGPLPEGEMTRE